MENHHASHRPHASWNNYRWTGTYLITIVTYDRQRVFGELRTEPEPYVEMTDLGRYMEQQWLALPDFHSQYDRQISVVAHQVMPDHFHGIIRVEAEMDVTLGEIMRGFKIACTKEWRRMSQPYMANALTDEQRSALSHMSRRQREEYYRKIGIAPLFDEDYDDSVCFREGQLENAIWYVHDNPRRAAIKRANPELFKLQCLWLAERGVVWVSAGISEGEKQICRAVREEGFPLVVLLNEGFPAADSEHAKYYKPQGVYFDACAAGQLLLIEPGDGLFEDKDIADEVYRKDPRCTPNSKRYRFLALNAMARRMCNL